MHRSSFSVPPDPSVTLSTNGSVAFSHVSCVPHFSASYLDFCKVRGDFLSLCEVHGLDYFPATRDTMRTGETAGGAG